MSAINDRLGDVEKMMPKVDGIVITLAALAPKIEDIHKFSTHTAPHLATKEFVVEKINSRLSKASFLAIAAIIVAGLAIIAGLIVSSDFRDATSNAFHSKFIPATPLVAQPQAPPALPAGK